MDAIVTTRTLALALAGAAGCATPPVQEDRSYEEPIYLTGSRIPVKDKSTVQPSARQDVDDFMRQRQLGAPRGTLGGN